MWAPSKGTVNGPICLPWHVEAWLAVAAALSSATQPRDQEEHTMAKFMAIYTGKPGARMPVDEAAIAKGMQVPRRRG